MPISTPRTPPTVGGAHAVVYRIVEVA